MKDVDEAQAENRMRPSLDTVCDSYRNVIGIGPGTLWEAKPDLNANPVGWPSHVVQEKSKRIFAANMLMFTVGFSRHGNFYH